MKWIIGALMLTGIFMGVQTLRADEVREYAKLICKASSGQAASADEWPEMVHGFFKDARSIQEIRENHGERYDHLIARCDQKRKAKTTVAVDRLPADWSHSSRFLTVQLEQVQVSASEAQPFGQPCTMDENCKSKSCDVQFGKCNLKFIVPALAVTQ